MSGSKLVVIPTAGLCLLNKFNYSWAPDAWRSTFGFHFVNNNYVSIPP